MRDSRARSLAVEGGRLAMLLAAVGVAVRMRLDPDLWGHLRFGLDSLERGLDAQDRYSFTQDVPWINHEWLSELATAWAYGAAGVTGLLILKCLVVGLAFAVSLAWASAARAELRGWLAAAAFIGLYPIAVTLRPQLWTILGVALLCAILAGRIRLFWMPLLFALWANLHGGWIVGGGIGGLWCAGQLLDTRKLRSVVPTGIALAASLLATLANPYGWQLWRFLLTTVRMSRPDITEWAPYWESFGPEHLVLWPLSAAVLIATLALRWRATRWATLLPALFMMASGLRVYRLAPLGGMLVLFFAADAWRSENGSESEPREASRNRIAKRWIEAVVLLAFSLPILLSESRCLPIDDPWAPDLVAAGALDEPSLQGKLLLPFDWGEYAIWHFGDRLRVSIDGRRETVYSPAALDRQSAILRGSAQGLAALDEMRPDIVWLPGTPEVSPLAAWLLEHGYRVDVQTQRSFVATRSDLPALAAGKPKSACFP